MKIVLYDTKQLKFVLPMVIFIWIFFKPI